MMSYNIHSSSYSQQTQSAATSGLGLSNDEEEEESKNNNNKKKKPRKIT
jgi:hypothetical protein